MMQPPVAELVHHSAPATLAMCVTASNGQTVCTGAGVGASLAVFGLVYLAVIVVSIVATVKVVTKAGYSGWWALIMFVPLVNFVMMLVFAFSKWPVLHEVEALRSQSVGARSFGPLSGRGWGFPTGGSGFGGGPYGSGPPGTGTVGASGPAGGVPGAWSTSPATPTGRVPVESDVPLPSFWGPPPGEQTGATAAGPTAPPPPAGPPPGWYPTSDGRQRYWDGTAWTDHFA